jgi:hypothetical protein
LRREQQLRAALKTAELLLKQKKACAGRGPLLLARPLEASVATLLADVRRVVIAQFSRG